MDDALERLRAEAATCTRCDHKTPTRSEVAPCGHWLVQELALVAPRVVVALGGTAAKALLGPGVKVTEVRGRFLDWDRAPLVLATVHPSSILRAPDGPSRASAKAAFVADLRVVAGALG